jgi:adenosyl cobinamide kinase/adenosyl cobinamide phosphate guanylyltransferase
MAGGSEAAERVETTLYNKMIHLAAEDRFDELEEWLDRLLQRRQEGWRLGLFSLDAHLKNYGAIGGRIVLLDTGGLTNRWSEVEQRLEAEESMAPPHVRLGLGATLADHSEIAQRFDERWRAGINPAVVKDCWPDG